MIKVNYIIIMLFLLTHCSVDTKTGLWENKNSINVEKKISKISFDKELTFEDFKKNVVLYGKKSKYPNIIN